MGVCEYSGTYDDFSPLVAGPYYARAYLRVRTRAHES